MAKKKREEASGGSWLDTYADMVTLLLCFFVLQLSFSSIDAEKWEQFVKAFVNPGDDTSQIVLNVENAEQGTGPLPNMSTGDEAGGGTSADDASPKTPEDFSDLYEFLKQYVQSQGLEGSIEVSKSGEGVVYIRFQNNIFFEPDKYALRPQAHEILDYIGDCLYAVEDQIYLISINGHTAEVQYDYAISDWMLSSERASSVAIFLEEHEQIDPTKMRPIGYGKNYPIADNTTQDGREKNRRVDITIVRNQDSGSGQQWTSEELTSLFDPTKFPRSGDSSDIMQPEDPTEGIPLPETEPGAGENLEPSATPETSDITDTPSGNKPVEIPAEESPLVSDGNT